MEFEIREMLLADLDPVLAIERASFPTPWSRSMFEHDLLSNPYGRFFVAEDPDGEILGYIGSWFVYEECHIGTIAVHREHRGEGLASELVRHTAAQALSEDIDYIILEVRTNNDAAISLYQSLGFRQVGLRKGYYTDTGDDAYLMMHDRLGELAGDWLARLEPTDPGESEEAG